MDYYKSITYRLDMLLESNKGIDKLVIYPFGQVGMMVKEILNKRYFIEEAYIIDNKLSKYVDKIIAVDDLKNIDTSKYLFLVSSNNPECWDEIRNHLKKYVKEENICDIFMQKPLISKDPRIASLELASREIYDKKIEGLVAEAGVWKGDYASYINRFFPDKKLYLFDTFEGLPQQDIDYEYQQGYTWANANRFQDTTIELVLSKMLYKENVVIKKGYFPDTTEGIEEKFCYVNLDMDMYQPIYAGLEFFYPRLVSGGYIFVHDCCIGQDVYKGPRQALLEFSNKYNVGYVMLPDNMTAVITK